MLIRFFYRRIAGVFDDSAEINLPGPGEYLPSLDAMRGLAVLAVALYHFGGRLPGPASAGVSLLPAMDVGTRGVDLFFLLSGFLITGILYDTKGQRGTFANFVARRILRIFPLYYAVLVLTLIVWPAISGQVSWQQEAVTNAPWLWLYGSNILIAWRGEWCLGAFDHFWSLAVEEQFYLVWPALILGVSRNRAMQICGGLFALAVVSRFAWAITGQNEISRYAFTLFRLDSLVAGAWLALAARGPSGLGPLVRPSRLLFWCIGLLLVPLTLAQSRLLTLVDTLWTFALSAFLIQMIAARPSSLLGILGGMSFLQWFGKYSYGIYVFSHLLIWLLAPFVTAKAFADMAGNAYLGQVIYLLMVGTVTVGLAFTSWHLFEKHFVKLKERFQPTLGTWLSSGS